MPDSPNLPADKRRTPEQAAALVAPRDTLALPLGPGQPRALLGALSERSDFEELVVFSALLMGMYPLFIQPGVRLRSGFFGPVERGLRAAGHDVSFVPADFRRFGRIAEKEPTRVMATAVARPDAGGVSLSLHAGATVDALRACGRDPDRLLIVELNPALPLTHGLPPEHTHRLTADEIDIWIEAETPLPVLPAIEPGAIESAIAENAMRFVHPGCTLQTGIGGIPSRIVSQLAAQDGGDYGVHSEMFTDGLMALHRAGKVRNQKGLWDGVSVCTFAAGSPELYEWLDDNRDVRFLPVDRVNAPELIAANRDMVSINGALSVDLSGQVVAEAIGPHQYSGPGGHEDFAAGPGLETRDRALVCLPSTVKTSAGPISRIQAALPRGAIVTTPRHQVDVVVTEHGVAELAGRSLEERAEALLAIAHPDHRSALRAEAGRVLDGEP